jgi:hypothetical protein
MSTKPVNLKTTEIPSSAPSAQAPAYVAARDFMRANSKGSYWDDNKTTPFPAVDDGNCGTRGYATEGALARKLINLAKGCDVGVEKALEKFGYNPAKQMVLVCFTSDDECHLLIGAFDPTSQAYVAIADINTVDIGSSLKESEGKAIFGSKYDADADGYDLSEDLLKNAVQLDLE